MLLHTLQLVGPQLASLLTFALSVRIRTFYLSTCLRSLLALSVILLTAHCTSVQAQSPASAKITKRIYTGPNKDGLTVDAEISMPANPEGGMVRIKYLYNNRVPIQDGYASWKIKFIDENDQLVIKQVSVPIGGSELIGIIGETPVSQRSAPESPFNCKAVVDPCFDITTSSKPNPFLSFSPTSMLGDSISGSTALQAGQSTTLSLKGGALGSGGSWRWYEGQCGGAPVGKGRTLTVTPRANTVYYVRAEPGTGTCLSTTVRVDNRSVTPTAIAGPTSVCPGEIIRLTVQGGALGVDAAWVWYRDACGQTKIGEGESITITGPLNGVHGTSLKYYVRAEGKYNTTACVSIPIAVQGSSVAATGIKSSGPTTFCAGSQGPLTLTIVGGQLAHGARWVWYRNAITSTAFATGESAVVVADVTTTYLVRAESSCPSTSPVSLTVEVTPKSIGALGINGPGAVRRKQSFLLQVNGGQLGGNSSWRWYAKDCKEGKYLGSGESISLKLRKTTQVFVKAVGACGETDCTGKTIAVGATRQWEHLFEPKKFTHFGIGFGLDYQHVNALVARERYNLGSTVPVQDSIRRTGDGFGLIGELRWHPLIKNAFSLGFNSSAALGTGLYNVVDRSNLNKKFTYYELRAGGELALGRRTIKLLALQEHRFRSYNLQEQGSNWKIRQHNDTYFITVGAGVRLGGYGLGKKPGHNLDLFYSLTQARPVFTNRDLYSNLGAWKMGAGLHWWHHNKFGLQLETILKSSQQENSLISASTGTQFNASFVLRQDFFR